MSDNVTESKTELADRDLSLDQLIQAFEAAHSDARWSRIAELNEQTRPCVEAAMAAAGNTSEAVLMLKPKPCDAHGCSGDQQEAMGQRSA